MMRYTGRDKFSKHGIRMSTDLLQRVQALVSRVTGKDAGMIQPEMKIDDLVTDSVDLCTPRH